MFKAYVGLQLVASFIFLKIELPVLSIVHAGFVLVISMIALKDEINN